MEDHVRVGRGLRGSVGVADVPVDEIEVRVVQALEVRAVALGAGARAVVEHAHGVAVREALEREIRADEPAAAGDQDLHAAGEPTYGKE